MVAWCPLLREDADVSSRAGREDAAQPIVVLDSWLKPQPQAESRYFSRISTNSFFVFVPTWKGSPLRKHLPQPLVSDDLDHHLVVLFVGTLAKQC